MCVVGQATVEACVKSQYIGKVHRIVEMATSLGTTAGSLLTGLLFGLGGYWSIWLSVVGVIAADILLRLLMVDPPEDEDSGACVVQRVLSRLGGYITDHTQPRQKMTRRPTLKISLGPILTPTRPFSMHRFKRRRLSSRKLLWRRLLLSK